MATFWERAQNLVDDRQSRQASAEVANVKTQTLTQTRDELLGRVLEVQQIYREEFVAAKSPEARKAVAVAYMARLEGINDAFTVLRQSEPGITTKIDADQFRRDAERYAEQLALRRAYEQSLAQTRSENARGLSQTGAGAGFSH